MTAFDSFIDALRTYGNEPKEKGHQWRAKCPAHNGNSDSSLVITPLPDSILVCCHGGCDTDDVLAALDLTKADLFDNKRESEYDYAGGRKVHRTPDKKFFQSGNTADRSLYRVERIQPAIAADIPVFVVEGEKDVQVLETLGLTATTSAMGAGSANKFDWTPLTGATVYIIRDNDERGHEYADTVYSILEPLANSVTVFDPADGCKDATDHIMSGNRIDELVSVESPRGVLDLRHRALTVEALLQLRPPTPLLDGFLYRGTLAQLCGKPGSYKTFLTIAWACAIAAGCQSWEGYPIQGGGGTVLYIAAEGASGLGVRIKAWQELTIPNDDLAAQRLAERLLVYPRAIQLGKPAHVQEVAAFTRHIGAALVVIDTRARCTLDLEENNATEQGQAIDAADQIREACGATVLVVHHSARGATTGRGSSAWDGAIDSDLRIKSDAGNLTVECEKHKDTEAQCTHDFELVPHTVAETAMPGATTQQRSTLVVTQAVTIWSGTSPETAAKVVSIVTDCALGGGLTVRQIIDFSDGALAEKTAYRAVKALVEQGTLKNVGTESRARYKLSREVD